MGGLAIGAQAGPEISCLIVGAVRVIIDVRYRLSKSIFGTDLAFVARCQICHFL